VHCWYLTCLWVLSVYHRFNSHKTLHKLSKLIKITARGACHDFAFFPTYFIFFLGIHKKNVSRQHYCSSNKLFISPQEPHVIISYRSCDEIFETFCINQIWLVWSFCVWNSAVVFLMNELSNNREIHQIQEIRKIENWLWVILFGVACRNI
jgi:hypothetical protein